MRTNTAQPGAYDRRPLQPADAGALRSMAAACEEVDGPGSAGAIYRWAERCDRGDAGDAGTTAVWETGGVTAAFSAAVVSKTPQEFRIELHGRTHPDHRHGGLGSMILSWSEDRARDIAAIEPAGQTSVLRIDSLDVTDDAARLYERHGFQFAFAEDLLQRDLQRTIPAVQLPSGISLASWAAATIPMFYAAYTASFRERPGFPRWSEEQWATWIAEDEDFSPATSFVALAGAQAAGFIVTAVDGSETAPAERSGWIVQVGSIPEWRGKHVGAALVCRVMHYFREQGLERARLHVNANNPRAAEVYRRLGFEALRRRSVFQKPAAE